jgi:hypothetical protein
MDDKPLPHPPYSDEYVLPKTRYGVPVRPAQFVSVSNVSKGLRESGRISQEEFGIWLWMSPGSFEKTETKLPASQFTELPCTMFKERSSRRTCSI